MPDRPRGKQRSTCSAGHASIDGIIPGQILIRTVPERRISHAESKCCPMNWRIYTTISGAFITATRLALAAALVLLMPLPSQAQPTVALVVGVDKGPDTYT